MENKYASLDKYILVKFLGAGHNCKVKLGFDPSTNQYFAIKIIKHSHPLLNPTNFKREIEILNTLKHPNIVNLVDYHESVDYIKKNGDSYKTVAVVMELVPGGEMFDYVAMCGRFSEEVCRTYFRSLIETLEYCHGENITHRDLKPENLLFDASFNLKVADFGFANLISGKDGSGKLHSYLGTANYMAPEIMIEEAYNGAEVDLFAAAVILFIMYSGSPPFGQAHPQRDQYYKLLCNDKAKFWMAHERNKASDEIEDEFFNDGFKDLVTTMLSYRPNERLTIQQIKEHPWYNGPVADLNALKIEFQQRRKQVDAENKRQRELKKEEKLMAQMQQQNYAQNIFTGVRPFRSLEIDMAAALEKQLEGKVDFKVSRKIQEYRSEASYKPFTSVFSVLDADFLFKVLCSVVQESLSNFTISNDTYKIKGKANRDDGDCELNILLTKVDDATTCIEFTKRGGDMNAFYSLVEEIKGLLPTVEGEGEAKQINQTAE